MEQQALEFHEKLDPEKLKWRVVPITKNKWYVTIGEAEFDAKELLYLCETIDEELGNSIGTLISKQSYSADKIALLVHYGVIEVDRSGWYVHQQKLEEFAQTLTDVYYEVTGG
jgi:hypothetical protein